MTDIAVATSKTYVFEEQTRWLAFDLKLAPFEISASLSLIGVRLSPNEFGSSQCDCRQ